MKTIEAMNLYLETKTLKPKTAKGFRRNINYFADMFPELPQDSLSLNHFSKHCINDLHLAPITANLAKRNVIALYHFLELHELIPPANYLKRVEQIKIPVKKRVYFNAEQLARIQIACKNEYDLALVLTFTDSLARVGEIGYDPDKSNKDMLALKGKHVQDNKILVCGKTDEVEHRLDPIVCKMLQRLAGSPESYVFREKLGKSDKPSTPTALSLRIRKILLNAGITGHKLGPHTLRHSSASLVMSASNGNISLVQAMLQHSNPKTTQIYVHDWQSGLQQTVSPLSLIKDAVHTNHPESQLSLPSSNKTTSTSLIPPNEIIIESDNTPDQLIEQMYPESSQNTSIRPLLKPDDIALIRRAFIYLAQFSQITTDAQQSRHLYNRMLRRADKKDSDLPSEPTTLTNLTSVH